MKFAWKLVLATRIALLAVGAEIHAPNLNQLSARGMRFAQLYNTSGAKTGG